ncbi:GNAT family N-acetyltransferase [Thioclava sp. F34-6]|nr:GNAT family N-acetyltransferase [Thioclava sp. F34-6]
MRARTDIFPDWVPRIETDRLLLRAPVEEDFPVYCDFFGDAEASRFYGGPLSPAAAWARLTADVGHWVLRGHGVWAIDLVEERRCVGTCGIVHANGWPRHELTWWIARDARRRGIAAEASRGVITWALDNGWDAVETHMRDENEAAQRLTEKLGGEQVARERFPDGIERSVYRFPRPRA